MSVAEHCRGNPVTVRADESVRAVARRLDQEKVGCAFVVDLAGHPVGVVTDRDIALSVLRRRRDPETTTASQVMHADPICVRENAPLVRALRRMRSDGVRRIGVIDDQGRLTGVIAWDDALQVLAAEVVEAAAVARAQMPGPAAAAQ